MLESCDRLVFALGLGIAMVLICGINRRSFGLATLTLVMAWSFTTIALVLSVGGITFFFVSREIARVRGNRTPRGQVIDGNYRVIDTTNFTRKKGNHQ